MSKTDKELLDIEVLESQLAHAMDAVKDLREALEKAKEEQKPCMSIKIEKAWTEDFVGGIKKLCVRYDAKCGAETLGCFKETLGCFKETQEIKPSEFVGLSINEANNKFNKIVYPHKRI